MKIYLTRQDFSNLATQLCSQIIPIRDQFEWIVGIERGGLYISNWLAYVLGKKHTSIKIQFYGDGTEVKKSAIWQGHFSPAFDGQESPFLVVDDIVDSGRTVEFFKTIAWHGFPNPQKPAKFWVAALHWCKENSPNNEPDFYAETKKKDDWIVYPWEKD